MSQFLAAIRLIISLLPLITETVKGLQAAFPGAGTAKLDALTAIVQEAANADAALTELYTQAAPRLAPILSAFVALIKRPATP
jgi:hypothetical protein